MKTKSLKYIHVAGTNGKGSTCAFIAEGLFRAGYRVGKFSSPHVLDICERITLNNIPINREKLNQLCGEIDCPQETPQFERLMNAAFAYFKEENADYAVVETGIGGLLDCTNRITPVVSVITRIGFDHMDILGDTIAEIAAHKAGIIKAGIPVVTTATQPEEAMRVIRETAAEKSATIASLVDIERSPALFPSLKITMSGEHQKENAAIAAATLNLLGVNEYDFSRVRLRGRMETVSQKPLIIVDGAHNPDALHTALKTAEEFARDKIIIVFGMLKSKDHDTCMKILRETRHEIILTDGFSDMATECGGVSVHEALNKAKSIAESDGLILVCGSLYLAGEALKELEKNSKNVSPINR
ncbi:MAG: bifunctional folylpolyglutamate synthase/dihydrofolate synthase [Oscillospiraceae bacterium]|nr:bifunctional folylpolyglutamate synthase/dihydrofolate synthase [Oscillospiraceae bacterium]